MKFTIVTLFPEFFESPLKTSLLGKAVENKNLEIDLIPLRNFGFGKYRAVDDKPYGGFPGMVISAEVIEACFQSILNLDLLEKDVTHFKQTQTRLHAELPYVVYLSPQGKLWTASGAREFAKQKHVLLLCGHYEGIDERVIDAFVHEEISIGDFILMGGETAALSLLESTVRFVDGVVGDPQSVEQDSFESAWEQGLKGPVYTRPATWRNREVPAVLSSGHHAEVLKWQKEQGRQKTKSRKKS